MSGTVSFLPAPAKPSCRPKRRSAAQAVRRKHVLLSDAVFAAGSETLGRAKLAIRLNPACSPDLWVHAGGRALRVTQQGVHIGEFHFLEELARDRVCEFCYVCMTNKLLGTTAGFTLRPIALR